MLGYNILLGYNEQLSTFIRFLLFATIIHAIKQQKMSVQQHTTNQ